MTRPIEEYGFGFEESPEEQHRRAQESGEVFEGERHSGR